jgi:hypothetical protein
VLAVNRPRPLVENRPHGSGPGIIARVKWKTFALLESSFCVLLSVLAIILMGFVLVENGTTGLARLVAWGGIVGAAALTLVAHGQLIGSFRRRGKVPVPQTGSVWIPILTVGVLGVCAALAVIVGSDFVWKLLEYLIVPPTLLALLSRLLVVRSLRQAERLVSAETTGS